METPSLVVWVVVSKNDENVLSVQERAYPTYETALKRADHLEDNDGLYSLIWPVKIYQEPQMPVYAVPPAPKMPPSAVYTPEGDTRLQVGYDYPRRVFKQPVSLSEAVSSTWDAWVLQQAGQGNFEEAALGKPEVAQLFEESPSGSVRLFPRELPAPAH